MTVLSVICITIVAIIAIVGTLDTIEKCSFYKWKAYNPEAFNYKEDN